MGNASNSQDEKKTLLIIQSFIFQVERYYECDALTQYMTLTFFI